MARVFAWLFHWVGSQDSSRFSAWRRLVWVGSWSLLVVVVVFLTVPASGDLAMVADDENDQAIVFDTDTGSVRGRVSVGAGAVGDCVVLPDQRLGFIDDFQNNLWVIDLAVDPPALAAGTNPIVMSNRGQDIAVAPGAEHLVVCGESTTISVIDVAGRTEVDAFDLGQSCFGVEVCSDGSVLAAHLDFDANTMNVRRLTLSSGGQLTDTGELIVTDSPTNFACAPDAQSAVVMELGFTAATVSIPGLNLLDRINLGGAGAVGQFDLDGDRVILRAEASTTLHRYDLATGTISDVPLQTIGDSGNFVPIGGIDTMAIDGRRERFFLTDGDSVRKFSTVDGSSELVFQEPGARLIGLCLPHRDNLFSDGFESGAPGRWTAQQP